MARRNVAAILLLLLGSTLAAAQGYMPSGTTNVRKTYVFGIHPNLSPQDLLEAYDPIARYLERKIPGTTFRIEASRDYADYEAKLAARRFHFALPNPVQTLMALDHGYKVIAKMTPDDDFRGVIVARADRAVATPAALAGKTLCFPSATALAATMLPLLYLHDNGLDVKSLKIRYVGTLYSAIINAHTGEYVACSTSTRAWHAWTRDNPGKAKEMKVLWRTDALPHNGVVARDDMPPAVTKRLAAVLVGLDKDREVDQGQFRFGQQHFELANDATYKPTRDFLRRYDQIIGLPASMQPRKN